VSDARAVQLRESEQMIRTTLCNGMLQGSRAPASVAFQPKFGDKFIGHLNTMYCYGKKWLLQVALAHLLVGCRYRFPVYVTHCTLFTWEVSKKTGVRYFLSHPIDRYALLAYIDTYTTALRLTGLGGGAVHTGGK
jgi:hypothetical protein